MNRTLALVSALVAGLSTVVFTGSAVAQAAAPAAPAALSGAPAAAQAPVKPEAIPAKIALINFEQAVALTNEGQKTLGDLRNKYAPQQTKLQNDGAQVDALKKQLEAAGNTLSDADHAKRLADIDAKEKQLNLDAETATNNFQAEFQDAMGKIAAKVSPVVSKLVQDDGFTILIGLGQQTDVMWADPRTDITQAVIDAYNKQSGVAAPLPAAPAAAAPSTRPHSATPKPATGTSK